MFKSQSNYTFSYCKIILSGLIIMIDLCLSLDCHVLETYLLQHGRSSSEMCLWVVGGTFGAEVSLG